jgi:uncharacterized protein (TIGR02996 family)
MLINLITQPEYLMLVQDANSKPGDNLPLLVIADWLEERGEEYYARYIRDSVLGCKDDWKQEGGVSPYQTRQFFVQRQVLNSVFGCIEGNYVLRNGFIRSTELRLSEYGKFINTPCGSWTLYTTLRRTQPGFRIDLQGLLGPMKIGFEGGERLAMAARRLAIDVIFAGVINPLIYRLDGRTTGDVDTQLKRILDDYFIKV